MSRMQQTPLFAGLKSWFSASDGDCQPIAWIASGVIILVGCFVLIGWSLDISFLKSALPEAATMKANFRLSLMVMSLVVIWLGLIGCNAVILNRLESELCRSSEERLQLALRGAGQGIWDWDLKTQVLTWDDRCKEIFGLAADLPVMYEWHIDALHPDDRQRVFDAAAIALRDQTEFNQEYRTFHPDGTMRWVLARGRGYYDAGGEPYRMSGTVLDISDRKIAEAALQQQTEELIQANRLKDEFLAALSHELRTPLNPILGWTKMLQGHKLTPAKTAQALLTIERNVRQQIALVDDLLDVSRVIQGKLQLEFHPVDLALTLNRAIETVHFAAQAKAITIELHGLSSLPAMGDSDRLQQIFWNLLSNAIKFTPTGGRVEVELSLVTQVNAARIAQIRVTDTGIGIAQSFLPHVFDHFRQADGSSMRKYGGLGLGGAIVRHLVELHGGTVVAESPGVGQGSTFTVKLPLLTEVEALTSVRSTAPIGNYNRNDPPQPLPIATSSKATTPLTGIHILLVDDEPDNLDLLCFLLEQDGAKVTAVTSSAQALEIITENLPDLIISDIEMPEMDGYELIRRIRTLPQGGQIPALALTGFARRSDQEQAIKAGFGAYIAKPVDPLQLLSTLTQLVQG